MTTYMVVSADEFELPQLITHDVNELVKYFNSTKASIYCDITRGTIKRSGQRIIKVEMEEDDEV